MKRILTFILLTSLFSCEPVATFTEPQPPDTDNLNNFPKRIQGQYLSLADNSTLKITDNSIFRIYDFDFKINIGNLDSTSKLSGDTLIDVKTNQKTLTKRIGDSLQIHFNGQDTLFQINESNILKKFKGYYFINTRNDTQNWEVKKIELDHRQLNVSEVSEKFDIEQLQSITEISTDTGPFKFTPTKKQFKTFIRNNGFSNTETFIRQK